MPQIWIVLLRHSVRFVWWFWYTTHILREAQARGRSTLREKLCSGKIRRDKQWWSTVKRAGSLGQHCEIPTIMDDSGNEYSTSSSKADAFGRYFAAKCSLGDSDFPGELPDVKTNSGERSSSTRFRVREIRNVLRTVDPSKANGLDQIPGRVLKMCADEVCKPRASLFFLAPVYWLSAEPVEVCQRGSRPQEEIPRKALELQAYFASADRVQSYGVDCQQPSVQISRAQSPAVR